MHDLVFNFQFHAHRADFKGRELRVRIGLCTPGSGCVGVNYCWINFESYAPRPPKTECRDVCANRSVTICQAKDTQNAGYQWTPLKTPHPQLLMIGFRALTRDPSTVHCTTTDYRRHSRPQWRRILHR